MDKTFYQNNFKHIAFFFTLFKGYNVISCIKLITEEKVIIGARENKLQKPQISQNEILHMTIIPVFSQFL